MAKFRGIIYFFHLICQYKMFILSYVSPIVISLILLPKRIMTVHYRFEWSTLNLPVHLVPLFHGVTHMHLSRLMPHQIFSTTIMCV